MYKELDEFREHMLSYIREYMRDIEKGKRHSIPEKSTPDQAEHTVECVLDYVNTEFVQSKTRMFEGYPPDIISVLDHIRGTSEHTQYRIDNKINDYFKSFRETKTKITKKELISAIHFFLEGLSADIDNSITLYLYDEAKTLSNAVERRDRDYDDW
jgi:hypothetical protein